MQAWPQALSPLGLFLVFLGAMVVALVWWVRWWFFARQAKHLHQEMLSQLQRQRRDLEEDLHQLQWRLEEARHDEEQLQHQLRQRDQLYEETRYQLNQCERRRAELQTRLDAEREHFSQQRQQLLSSEERLADTFKRLAGEIFEDKTRHFNEQSRSQLSLLLNPMQEQFKDFGALVRETHQQGMSRQAVLARELEQLRQLNHRLGDEAHQLVDALRGDVKVMGSWGEFKLERLLQLAGLEAETEYSLQFSVRDDNTGQLYRPDAVVWLPGDKALIIDAKVSLEHYRRFRSAQDSAEKTKALKLHLLSIRQHIRGLARKEYHQLPGLNSPGFVFMFVPSEPAYLDALQADPQLLADAQGQQVMLLAPANLLASLRTVASLWHGWRQNENALEIARRAGLLYDKFVGFVENMNELGQRLEQAQNSYDQAFNQLSRGAGNLVRQTEQLRLLGARASKQLDPSLLARDESGAVQGMGEANAPARSPLADGEPGRESLHDEE